MLLLRRKNLLLACGWDNPQLCEVLACHARSIRSGGYEALNIVERLRIRIDPRMRVLSGHPPPFVGIAKLVHDSASVCPVTHFSSPSPHGDHALAEEARMLARIQGSAIQSVR